MAGLAGEVDLGGFGGGVGFVGRAAPLCIMYCGATRRGHHLLRAGDSVFLVVFLSV